jgi:hypothetical protein
MNIHSFGVGTVFKPALHHLPLLHSLPQVPPSTHQISYSFPRLSESEGVQVYVSSTHTKRNVYS